MHELAHARAALAAAARHGVPVTLRTAPGAARYAGISFFAAMFDEARRGESLADFRIALDCGDDPALAHRALSMGFRHVVFTGTKIMRDKLSDIAASLEAAVSSDGVRRTALDLLDSRTPEADCEAHFARFRR